MNIKKKFIIILLLIIICVPVISWADSAGNAVPSTVINNPLDDKGINNINDFIKNILVGVIKIGIPIVALAIIYSGFLFVMALGKPDKLKTAKDALMYSLIGAAILLGSWAIAQLISETVLKL